MAKWVHQIAKPFNGGGVGSFFLFYERVLLIHTQKNEVRLQFKAISSQCSQELSRRSYCYKLWGENVKGSYMTLALARTSHSTSSNVIDIWLYIKVSTLVGIWYRAIEIFFSHSHEYSIWSLTDMHQQLTLCT